MIMSTIYVVSTITTIILALLVFYFIIFVGTLSGILYMSLIASMIAMYCSQFCVVRLEEIDHMFDNVNGKNRDVE